MAGGGTAVLHRPFFRGHRHTIPVAEAVVFVFGGLAEPWHRLRLYAIIMRKSTLLYSHFGDVSAFGIRKRQILVNPAPAAYVSRQPGPSRCTHSGVLDCWS